MVESNEIPESKSPSEVEAPPQAVTPPAAAAPSPVVPTPEVPAAHADVAPDAAPAPSELRAAEPSTAEVGDGDSDDGDESGDAGAEAGAGSEGDRDPAGHGGPEGEGGPQKKRRRRRKKKGGPRPDGEVAEAQGETRGPDAAPRREPHVPFRRFFEGEQALERRHAFSAGEIVAGRVERVTDSIIVLDLFGKATAFLDRWDAFEPEDLPADAEPAQDDDGDGAAAEAAAADGVMAEAAVTGTAEQGAPSEGGSTSAGADGGVVVVPALIVGEAAPAAMAPSEEAQEAALALADEAATVESADEGDNTDDAEEAAASAAPPALEPEPEGPPPEAPALGSIMRGRVGSVAESGHVALVNRYVPRADIKQRIAKARDARQRVTGLVYGFNRGGFDVLVRGVRAFCPANGMTLLPVEDPRVLVGQKLEFTLPPRKGKSRSIIVSRRTLLEREALKKRKAVLKSLEEGQELTGRVTQVREFGAFVDVGEGLEGLVHQSELSWQHGTRPADVVKPGDEVRVKVLGVQRDGKRLRNSRISLSMKALESDPWQAQADTLREGSSLKGTVTTTTDFGAFLKIADGIEGLLHITELGRDLKHASQAVNVGDEIPVVIDRIDRRQRRISLSKLSAAEAKALEEGKLEAGEGPGSLKPGSHIKVVITKVDHAGVQVQVKGMLGKRGRAFLPMRELGSLATGDGRQGLSVGTEIDVKVVPSERRGSLRVSVKGFEVDNERQAVRDYKKEVSKQGFGTFGDLLRAKLAPPGGSSSGQ